MEVSGSPTEKAILCWAVKVCLLSVCSIYDWYLFTS